MNVLAEVTAQAQQANVQDVPTAVVAVITVLITTLGGISVALIYRRGEGRTVKGDNIPSIIQVLESSIKARDASIDALSEDRDAWREMAWRQVQASETSTDEAFNDAGPRHYRPANETKQAIPPPP